MDLFVAGRDQSAADQTNNLVEGHPLKKRKRKNSAASDDTASMINGGGYLGARTRQPPTAQSIRKKLMWVRGVVCLAPTDPILDCCCLCYIVILQCIPCFYECMSELRSARGLSVKSL